MIRRMNVQDAAVLALLLSIYFLTLFFGASMLYRMSKPSGESNVTYYANVTT